MASAAAMLSGLVVSHAAASNLGDLQAQAQAVEARINALGNQENVLSERYDAAKLSLKQVEVKVAEARAAVATATGKAVRAKMVLRTDAVSAYVNNGSGSLSGSGHASTIAGADSSLLRAEYEQSLATDQTDSEDQYKLTSRVANSAEANLKVQQGAAAANLAAIGDDKKLVESAAASLETTEAQVKGRIASAIAEQQAAERRAQQLAAEQRLAAQRAAAQQAAAQQVAAQQAANRQAAAAQAQTVVPTPTVTPTSTPAPSTGTSTPAPTSPPASGAAAAAVQAAESRVGDPYVWGAAGPDAFDCSGLVMWAYAQAGISLPHFSGAQYADTTHISMADLEPGDLVFFANPGEHVAMYVGNGEVVQAPYTGADVQIVPLYSQFVLASRVS